MTGLELVAVGYGAHGRLLLPLGAGDVRHIPAPPLRVERAVISTRTYVAGKALASVTNICSMLYPHT